MEFIAHLQLLGETEVEFLELWRRASPRQIQIALYLMRLCLEQRQVPSTRVGAEIEKIRDAIETGRADEIALPSLH